MYALDTPPFWFLQENKKLNKKGSIGIFGNPLEPSLDHLWATLFHRLLQMGKGWLSES
jgi:hypothetical protein